MRLILFLLFLIPWLNRVIDEPAQDQPTSMITHQIPSEIRMSAPR